MKSTSHINQLGYDAMALAYETHRTHLGTSRYLHEFIKRLPKKSLVLDVGCGSGRLIDESLIKAGHLVTGIDISSKQIDLARKNCPTGEFIMADMETLQPEQFAVEGVVCNYALFHVPRESHQRMLLILASFLPIGGQLLVTMGDCDFEGMYELCGEQVWSSHYGPAKNRAMVEAAGFEIEIDEMDTSGGERHQVILAKKLNTKPIY